MDTQPTQPKVMPLEVPKEKAPTSDVFAVKSKPNKRKNAWKAVAVIMIVVTLASLTANIMLAYRLLQPQSDTGGNDSTYAAIIDTGTPNTSSQDEPEQDKGNLPKLTIADLSDQYVGKSLYISELDLRIETKFADFLEYRYLSKDDIMYQDSDGPYSGSYKYSFCNGDYFVCDAMVIISFKEKYLSQNQSYDYVDSDRDIVHIFQDSRNISLGGTSLHRYYGGTSLMFARANGRQDSYGRFLCYADVSLGIDINYPCEDIFTSIYNFNVL